MRGLVLTGPTGVGKSTAQRRLHDEHGFWTPRTCTTRAVTSAELDLLHVPEPDFLQSVRAGRIVFPATFGSAWYGWTQKDFSFMTTADGRAVLNVRPYTALVLQATLNSFVPVWLTINDEELARRRAGRHELRDTDLNLRTRRETQDREDLVYRPCFSHVCVADDTLIASLLAVTL
jgi:guanylate kinase